MIETRRRARAVRPGLGALAVAGLVGCGDLGSAPTPAPDSPAGPAGVLSSGVPARTVVGDTVRVVGRDLGDARRDRRVAFSGAAGRVDAQVVSWSDDEIRVIVPEGAISGDIVVVGDGGATDGLPFEVAPALVSYEADVEPLFFSARYGCYACHTGVGSGNFVLGTREELLRGDSDHGPVVTRRDGPGSVIVRKLLGTAGFGEQMPFGGAPMDPADILLISDWIDQGTRDN